MTDLEHRMTAAERAIETQGGHTAELLDAVAGEEQFGVRSGGLVDDMAEVKEHLQNGIKLRLSAGQSMVVAAIITGLAGIVAALVV